jgi:Gpi18-like mannosyltransferase
MIDKNTIIKIIIAIIITGLFRVGLALSIQHYCFKDARTALKMSLGIDPQRTIICRYLEMAHNNLTQITVIAFFISGLIVARL